MNKKMAIGIGCGVAVVGLVGVGVWLALRDKPVSDNDVLDKHLSSMEYKTPDDEEYVGVPVPNIINRGGTINKLKRNSIIITGPEDKDVTIYINDSTEIFGADGAKKEFSDLSVGMYIDVEIDGDLRDEADNDDEFEAMTIYIVGK